MRRRANVTDVPAPHLELMVAELSDFAVPVLQHTYDINANRHDPLIGDDAVTFAVAIYRNSWHQMEQAAGAIEGWTSSRPDGSLVLCRGPYRLHVYRHASDESAHLDDFRLDSAKASLTKLGIAEANRDQLTLDLEFAQDSAEPGDVSDLTELVIIHSGNPDDGCCGVWVGAPVTLDQATGSPWAWIVPLWLIDRPAADGLNGAASDQTRHDELAEPTIALELVDETEVDGAGAGAGAGADEA